MRNATNNAVSRNVPGNLPNVTRHSNRPLQKELIPKRLGSLINVNRASALVDINSNPLRNESITSFLESNTSNMLYHHQTSSLCNTESAVTSKTDDEVIRIIISF